MPNPKRRHSKSRTRKRRSHDFLTAPSLSICSNCGSSVLPHRVCANCGHYKGRQVIEVEDV
ncbi:MAG: 50S ribosomal protein L32 [Acidobacteriota bacterium]